MTQVGEYYDHSCATRQSPVTFSHPTQLRSSARSTYPDIRTSRGWPRWPHRSALTYEITRWADYVHCTTRAPAHHFCFVLHVQAHTNQGNLPNFSPLMRVSRLNRAGTDRNSILRVNGHHTPDGSLSRNRKKNDVRISDATVARGTVFDLSMLSLLGRDLHRTSCGVNQDHVRVVMLNAQVFLSILRALQGSRSQGPMIWLSLSGGVMSGPNRWRKTSGVVSVARSKRYRKALEWMKRNDGLVGMPTST